MNNLKKFENFNMSQNQPEKNCSHYSCDECDNIWKSDEDCDCCRFCDSNEIEELHEDEWNELNKMRLENN